MSNLRNRAVRFAALLSIGAIAAAPSLAPKLPDNAAAALPLAPALQESLADMSTGKDQQVLIAGSDAQSRNSRIPLTTGLLRSLSVYKPMSDGTPQYSTALRCLTQAVYFEAANEPRRGKQAVAQVVMNRMRHPAYPNSVCGVVYQGVNARVCQFSFTCDGALLRQPMKRQWEESLAVAREAMAGKQLPEVGTATHYHADYVVPKWAFTLAKLEVIGRHIFYRFPGRAGEPRAFSARWAGSERVPKINWARLNAVQDSMVIDDIPSEEEWVSGLTVVPHPTDRHASTDVGGRIDTTKEWRLTIPDPVASQSSYQSAIDGQVEAAEKPAPAPVAASDIVAADAVVKSDEGPAQ